jgi:hypothetical protein
MRSRNTHHISFAQPADRPGFLRQGCAIVGAGLLSALSVQTFFGGITGPGSHGVIGWLLEIIALMCLPSGIVLIGIGTAERLIPANKLSS